MQIIIQLFIIPNFIYLKVVIKLYSNIQKYESILFRFSILFVSFEEKKKEFCEPNCYRTMLDVEYQEQCRQFRSFSKQSEKFTCIKEDVTDMGFNIQCIQSSRRTRTRTSLRSSLSLCFTSSSITSQIDFS